MAGSLRAIQRALRGGNVGAAPMPRPSAGTPNMAMAGVWGASRWGEATWDPSRPAEGVWGFGKWGQCTWGPPRRVARWGLAFWGRDRWANPADLTAIMEATDVSYKRYTGYEPVNSGDGIWPGWALALQDGLQAEFEARVSAWALNGVISGCAPSIVTTTISIAAGVMFCSGKQYQPAPSVVSFTAGDGANTYYIYVDPTSNTAPYAKSTSNPGNAANIVLCSVAWNGSTTLSSLVDLRPWGIRPARLKASVVGAVSAAVIAHEIIERDLWIEDVQASLGTPGTAAGPTYVDVHAGAAGSAPATIFTTQARRPTIAYTDTAYTPTSGGVPEANRKLAAGSVLKIEVDAASTNAADLAVVVKGRWC